MLNRRSTALTSPLCDMKPRLWAMSTLVATAACGGVRKNRSWAIPSLNMSCTAAARGANGVLRHSAIITSIWPRRRSTVATSRRAKARSRPGSWCIAGLSSIASSSGRLRRRTAAIRSSATSRAIGAWDIKVLPCPSSTAREAERAEIAHLNTRSPVWFPMWLLTPDRQTVEAEAFVVHISVMDDRSRDSEGPPPAEPPANPPPRDRLPREIGGPKGPEPTRYGDWEFNGRCTDF